MLTPEQNDRLTRIGPGTPMGALMRRYWHPIAPVAELDDHPVKPIRLLGEDLVLFLDTSGRLGLVDNRCAHRLVKLEYGYPVAEGLRCPYHGWTYDGKGACVAQPAEPAGSTFKDKVRIKSYPVQELGGLVFAYLGPDPAPLVPRWEPLVMTGATKRVSYAKVPANWLQAMEMTPDQVHVQSVHGQWGKYILDNRLGDGDFAALERMMPVFRQRVIEDEVIPYKHGLLKRRVMEGGSRADEHWTVGQPMLLPNMHMTSFGGAMTLAWRVPDDDAHYTEWIFYCGETPWAGEAPARHNKETVPYSVIQLKNDQGVWNLASHYVQDYVIFEAQTAHVDRSLERLRPHDAGVVAYRRLLLEQLDAFEAGNEPFNVFRDESENQCLELPVLGRRKTAKSAP